MNKIVQKAQVFVKRNSSTMLTALGGAGLVATTVMAVKATPKAMELIKQAEEEKGDKLTRLEVVQAAGKVYIPTIIVGTSTLACIFGANALNKRKQAALMSAYALLDSSYKKYKDKVNEIYGEEAGREAQASIARDKYDESVEIEDNKELFYDAFSGRYFNSTAYEVLQAEYNLNRKLSVETRAYLNDFYTLLDVPPIDAGTELGWSYGILESHYLASWIEFDHEKVVMDDGLECTIIRLRYEPVIDFAYY